MLQRSHRTAFRGLLAVVLHVVDYDSDQSDLRMKCHGSVMFSDDDMPRVPQAVRRVWWRTMG